ncbi:MAG TPA: NUDIX domain-containing protein [Acidimicrobiales bacterium]|nr:NUDIX domain-containing protein [Acidimicrobiales bacterium]
MARRRRYRPANEEEAAYLAVFDPRSFPPVAVTVDVVSLTIRAGRLSVLLVQRGAYPYKGAWALPGGFVEPDEDTDAAAARELAEETGVASVPGHLEQLRTYSDPDRDPRMRVISVAYVGFGPEAAVPEAGSDATAARWWAIDDLEGPDAPALAFDHARIIADGVERARAKIEYTSLAASFVEEPFTLAELRRVYEAVWGVELHVGNFRRKVLSTPGFVTVADEDGTAGTSRRTGGRPATLYRRGGATVLHPAMLRP